MKLLGVRVAGGAGPILRGRQLVAVMARVDRLHPNPVVRRDRAECGMRDRVACFRVARPQVAF
jgi:hypothetical protein